MDQVEINLDLIRQKKVLVATPMYGGNSAAIYVDSIARLFKAAGEYGLSIDYTNAMNDALVQRARNRLVNEVFLKGEYDYLMFIDSDIGFYSHDVFYMMHLMSVSLDKNIIVGTYPKKRIEWKAMAEAANKEKEVTAEMLKLSSASYVVNFAYEDSKISYFNQEEPTKILDAGTGFMLISKKVFIDFMKAYPNQEYTDHDSKDKAFAFFDCEVDPDDNVYVSEDFFFTRKCRKIGHDTWLLPWLNLQHMGSFIFEGSFTHVTKVK
jgi:hypothetical protein